MKIPASKRISGSTPLSPKNHGRSFRAQQELDWTLSRANQQSLEAIAVDGFHINHWRRSLEGKRCTCQFNNTEAPSKLNPTTIEPDGYLSFTVSVNHNEFEKQNKTTKLFNGVTIGKLPEEEYANEKLTNEDDDLSEITEPLDDAVLSSPDSGILFGGDKSPCGICFGTGHINGYSLSFGKREIFDLSGSLPVELSRCHRDNNDLPNSIVFSLDSTAYAEWKVNLPYYFVSCVSINVFDNTELTNHFNVNVSFDDGATWAAATPLLLSQRKKIRTTMLLRIQPKFNELENTIRATHVEIIWQYNDWPKAQMGQVSQATNYGIFDTVITAEFTLPPTLNNVNKEDVLWDAKHNKLWKITDITEFKTSDNRIMGWTAQARVIQEYEQLSILKTYRNILPHYSQSTLQHFLGKEEKSEK